MTDEAAAGSSAFPIGVDPDLHVRGETVVYPSGAKLTVYRGPGYDLLHFETPFHEFDLYERLLALARDINAT